MEMAGGSIFILIIFVIIWGVILQSIIREGTKTKQRMLNDEMQIKLLAKIAEKLGVDRNEISECLVNKMKVMYDK